MAAIAEILSPETTLPVAAADGERLDVADLCRMFEESEESTHSARLDAERDRDYVDNKQLTAEEIKALKKRGQPPQIDNRIKSKIDYLVGLEKQQRIDPKALPRTPLHEADADGATQALRYVAETENYDYKRSQVWRNLLVEGAGGIGIGVELKKGGIEIKIRRWAWDRLFWDPHSSETDFSDAGYYGGVTWMDYADALAMYPDGKDALDNTIQTAPSQTYDDKPKFSLWADKKRKRVRICVIWLKRGDDWYFAEYTKGGILNAGPSPYVNDKGESDPEMILQSAYVDRDNNRYSIVREMITLQDGINKRKSKALHLINTHQTTYEDGAIGDIEEFRRQKARPDGTMKVNPGALSDKRIISETRADLAQTHMLLLQDDKNSIDLKGPNATAMGDKAQGSSAASGRAIIASQQGGMVALGDLLDSLRHLDKRVFRAIWARIRQFWTEEKWVRVTDDERNIKWVGVNIDPMKQQQLQMQVQQNPQIAQKIGGVMGSVAELDCDIIIDEVPDVIASQEQFGMLVELKKMDANNELPFTALVKASQIKDKSKMLEEMEKAAQARQQAGPPPEIAKAQMDAQIKQQAAQTDAMLAKQKLEIDTELAARKQQSDMEIKRQELLLKQHEADIEMQLAREKADAEIDLAREKAQHEADIQEFKAHNDQHYRKLNSDARQNPNDAEGGSETGDAPVMTALERITEIAAASHKESIAARKAASAPRRTSLIRGRDGRASGAISQIDEQRV